MLWIFEITDKTGRLTHLSYKQWLHTQTHPGMTISVIERIKETLISPYKIFLSESDSSAYFFFRYYKDRQEYLMVLVKYLNGNGFIITSFYTDTLQWKETYRFIMMKKEIF